MERGLKRRRCDEPSNLCTNPKLVFRLVFPYIMKVLERDSDRDLAKCLIQTCRELRNYPHLQREFARLTGKLFGNRYPLVGFATAAEKEALSGEFHQCIVHLTRYKRFKEWCQHDAQPCIKWLGDVAYGPVLVQIFASFEDEIDNVDSGVFRRRFYCFKAATFSEMCRWVYDTMTNHDSKYYDVFLVMPEWKAKGSHKRSPPHIVYDAQNMYDYSDQYMLAHLERIGRTSPVECGRSSYVVFMKHRKKKLSAIDRLKLFLNEWYYNWPWDRPNNEMKMTFTV